ncbi:MAG: hypothetical protein RL115_1167 [Bacteroidota bacterium]
MNVLEQNKKLLYQLCNNYKVNKVYAFGSVLTHQFQADSDVDLIVDFLQLDVADYADNYFGLKFSLEQLFKRPVDLLEEKAIKNPIFREATEKKSLLIYG